MKAHNYGISEKQKRVYDWIVAFIKERGYSPSMQEISDGMNTPTSNAYRYIKQLKARGLIDFIKGKNRSIIVMELYTGKDKTNDQ